MSASPVSTSSPAAARAHRAAEAAPLAFNRDPSQRKPSKPYFARTRDASLCGRQTSPMSHALKSCRVAICGRPAPGKGRDRCSAWSDVVIFSGLDAARRSRRPVRSSRTRSRSPIACSRHCGKPWLSRPRLANCCAIVSFRSPYAIAIVVGLRHHDRSSLCTRHLDQPSPDDTGHLDVGRNASPIISMRAK